MRDHAALITRAEDDIQIWSTTFGRNDLIRELVEALRATELERDALEQTVRSQGQSHHFAAGSL